MVGPHVQRENPPGKLRGTADLVVPDSLACTSRYQSWVLAERPLLIWIYRYTLGSISHTASMRRNIKGSMGG